MSRFVLGIIIGIAVVFGGLYTYFMYGLAPVATSAQPMPFEKRFAKGALHAHVNREMPKDVPLPWNEANLVAGAQVYKQHCAVCHGLAGREQTAIAKGMFPEPPKLMEGVGVTDDPPQESFWKVKNGIRMTGMPGFQHTLTDSELWQVSLMLANANKLPQSAKDVLSATMPAPLEPPPSASESLRR